MSLQRCKNAYTLLKTCSLTMNLFSSIKYLLLWCKFHTCYYFTYIVTNFFRVFCNLCIVFLLYDQVIRLDGEIKSLFEALFLLLPKSM